MHPTLRTELCELVGLFTVLPGAPRTPSSWALGRAQGPMQAMFWFPYRSIWVAPIITWRRPDQTTSNILPNGSQASTVFGPVSSPIGIGAARASASPSV